MRTTLLWTLVTVVVLWVPVMRQVSTATVAPDRVTLLTARAERGADNKIIVWTSLENPGVSGRTIHQLIVALDSANHQVAALPTPTAEDTQPLRGNPSAFALTPSDFVGPVQVIVTLSERDGNGTIVAQETRTLDIL